MISVLCGSSYDEWRAKARDLLSRRTPPEQVDWVEAGFGDGLFVMNDDPAFPLDGTRPGSQDKVPSAFLDLARTVCAHPDGRRVAVLYRMLWRLVVGQEKYLLAIPTDPDVHQAEQWRKAVARDIHKMHAFVRFRLVGTDEATGREQFVAWHEPSTRCVRLAVPFFQKRFAGMDWSILTPDECAHWDGERLHFTPGLSRDQAPGEDALDGLWRTYYKSIFNPARLKVKAMQSEMPVKFWKNLPEASLIPGLIAGSQARMQEMLETEGRRVLPVPRNDYIEKLHERHEETWLETVPQDVGELGWEELRQAVCACRACPLWEKATQAVPGQGPETARVMIVGEQPGDREDLSGEPFTGPAGQVLRNAMMVAGLNAAETYLTNAVKHFKWTPQGQRRKHVTPGKEEVKHCRPWVLAELRRVQPEVIVLLGRTAALSLLGRDAKVTEERGLIAEAQLAKRVILTYHPSYLLRLPAGPVREQVQEDFTSDLRLAAGI